MFYAANFDIHDDAIMESFDTSDLKARPEKPNSRAHHVADEHTESPVWTAAAE